MSPLRRKKTKIGELLVLTGSITSEQLQQALVIQHEKEHDKLLGQILVELGHITKEKLEFVLSIQLGYPYIHIKQHEVNLATLSLIPEAIVKKYRVFPIDKIQDVLTIAMINPLDKYAIDQIKKLSGCNISIFLSTPTELEEMISTYYGTGVQ